MAMAMARCNDLPASARSRHETCQLLQSSRIRAVAGAAAFRSREGPWAV